LIHPIANGPANPEVADRIDHGDAGSGGGTGQEGDGQRPEHRQACENAEASKAKRDHLQQGIIERGGDGDTSRLATFAMVRTSTAGIGSARQITIRQI
jgi:hypothetical protein